MNLPALGEMFLDALQAGWAYLRGEKAGEALVRLALSVGIRLAFAGLVGLVKRRVGQARHTTPPRVPPKVA